MLLARVESTIRYPWSRRRGIDVSKIIWPTDFPLCRSFLRVDRSREGCRARFKFFLPFGRVYVLSPSLSLFNTRALYTHTHTHTCTIEQRRYVSSASSFSSACEDKRTSSKTDRPLALHDTPRVIKRREETRELLCITRDAREP